MQISKIDLKSNEYPSLLREIHYPPKQLYVLGEIPEGPYVAIVGSRRCTPYGRDITQRLAYQAAKAGAVIVSGLAYGIDAVAHRAALEAGGKVVAVIASGIDKVGPAGNRGLARRVAENGAIISEYPLGVDALKHHFVARNRIIAGLCPVTVVTEAPASSGALITGNFALETGRAVMAVPGRINDEASAGANNLLRRGASPIADVTDVILALELEASLPPVKAESKEEAIIIDLISQGTRTSQELIEQSAMNAIQFAQVISLMEITGKVLNHGAGNWSLRQ